MPRRGQRICGKDNRPWHRRRFSVELSIDEVRAADEEKSNRCDDAERVADTGPRMTMAPRPIKREEHKPYTSPVPGHAPFPYSKKTERRLRYTLLNIKNPPAKPAAEQHAKHCGP